jgi:hypothetical protein
VAETDWKDTRLEPSPCPWCGKLNDAATGLGETGPRPGDFSVCLTCAQPLVFDETLRTRAMTMDEFRELPEQGQSMVRLYLRAVRAIDRHPAAEREATAAAARPRGSRRRAFRRAIGRGRP